MLRYLLSISILGFLLSPVTAQTASYTYYGQGCQYPAHAHAPSQLVASGAPKLGGQVSITYSGYWGREYRTTQFLLVTGLSDSQMRGLPLPLPAPLIVPMPHPCLLLCSAEIIAPSTGHVVMPIPNDPRLLGLTLYQQWWVQYLVVPQPQYVWQVSNGGKMVIGL